MMKEKLTAIVSAHIFLDENGRKDIEILSQVSNDDYSGIFDDIDHALLDQIEIDFEKNFPESETKSYFFIAIIKSEFVEYKHFEGSEWEAEHEIIEIKNINDMNHLNLDSISSAV